MSDQSVIGQIDNAWITNLSLSRPDIREKYFEKYGDNFSNFFEFVQTYSEKEEVGATFYKHFEEGRFWGDDAVETTTSAGANGALVTVTLENQTVAGSSTYVFMQENDLVETLTGIKCVVQEKRFNVTHWEVDLIPLIAAENIPILTAGDKIINESNAAGEGTGQGESRKTPLELETGWLQIIKSDFEITGTAKTEQEWIPVSTPGGNFTFHREQMHAEHRHKQKIGQMMLTGKRLDNTLALVDKNGKARGTSEGAIEFARARGNVQSIAAGTMTLNDFDAIENYAVSNRTDGVILMLSALTRQQEIDKLLHANYTENNMIMLKPMINKDLKGFPENSAAAVRNFKTYTSTRNTYYLTSLDMLNNPISYSNTGFAARYSNISLILPFGKTRDPKSKKWGPKFGCAYKGTPGYNRFMEVWQNGTARPTNRIGDIDIDQLHLRSDVGTRFALGNQWQLITD